MSIPLLFSMGSPGRRGYRLPDNDVPTKPVADLLPPEYLRESPPELPEVSELEVVRHFTQLSRLNHGVDVGFYPLGSCTMKYNPRINEDAAGLPGFALLHPYQPEETVQGALELMDRLCGYLGEIAGLPHVTLHPAAGAHGELVGLLLIKAYHKSRGDAKRREIIVPDAAHGTNPATAAMCGYDVVEVPSDERGGVDVERLRELLGPQTAGLMLTNPNTLGLFDENILEITQLVHEAGGLLYYDGANMNANLGISRPGDMGFDIVHFNLHKTFSTPHGGGGPGAGPIAVSDELAPFLPTPTIGVDGQGRYYFDYHRPQSIGPIKGFYGNFGVLVRAYTYIRMMGPEGLRQASEDAVLNANYLLHLLKDYYEVAYPRYCKHEFVLSAEKQRKERGVRTLDIAKRLLDFGYHAPTVYFPLIVDEAMMIEPTETETKETLDGFAQVMIQIAQEIEEEPEKVQGAPYTTYVGRLDETLAARQLNLRWKKGTS
ncbi:MAG: aminomethyl-transferring glycine dehydrogenase subunit GcvPB [Limnochordia bacterium]|jgi:glycine dehydrogenase subunit 2